MDPDQDTLDRLLLRTYDAQAVESYTGTRLQPMQIRQMRAYVACRDIGRPDAKDRLMYLLLVRERDPHVLREDH